MFTAVVLVVGFIAVLFERAMREQDVARRLLSAGYRLSYDYGEAPPDPPPIVPGSHAETHRLRYFAYLDRASGAPPPRAWPFHLMPHGLFHSVHGVSINAADGVDGVELHRLRRLRSLSIHRTPVTPEDWRSIGRLSSLKSLFIGVTEQDSTGLRKIAHLKQLEQLGLRGPVSTELEQIGELSRLEYLSLWGSDIGDNNLGGLLPKLPALETLDLSGARVTGLGLPLELRAPSVRFLSLKDTPVTNEGLGGLLRVFPSLEALDLSGAKITGDGLAQLTNAERLQTLRLTYLDISGGVHSLSSLKKLRELDLSFTDAEGADLKSLRTLKNLGWLQLEGALLEDEQVQAFRMARPRIEVVW